MPKSRYIGKTHGAKGNKHPGIYKTKSRCFTPRKTKITVDIPFEIAERIQDMYPNVSLRIATQKYLQKELGEQK